MKRQKSMKVSENPFFFCKKVKLSCEERESAESIIRYNSYIYRMLINQIQDMNEDVRKRLQNNIKKLKFLKVEQKNIGILERDLNYPDIHKVEIREKGWEEILPYKYVQSYGAIHLRHYFAKRKLLIVLRK